MKPHLLVAPLLLLLLLSLLLPCRWTAMDGRSFCLALMRDAAIAAFRLVLPSGSCCADFLLRKQYTHMKKPTKTKPPTTSTKLPILTRPPPPGGVSAVDGEFGSAPPPPPTSAVGVVPKKSTENTKPTLLLLLLLARIRSLTSPPTKGNSRRSVSTITLFKSPDSILCVKSIRLSTSKHD